jgi:hypothetical protein
VSADREGVTTESAMLDLAVGIQEIIADPAVPDSVKATVRDLRYLLICMVARIDTLEQREAQQ